MKIGDMKRIYTVSQAREADVRTSQLHKIPGLVLMERAALSVSDYIEDKYAKRTRILCLAGTGNNGGDAMALCRILFVRGFDVSYCLLGPESRLSESAKIQYQSLLSYGLSSLAVEETDFKSFDLIVDGIFGIGLSRDIQHPLAELIGEVNASGRPVIAMDIPSGLNADTGAVMGACIRASETFSFQFLKPGILLGQGRSVCGRVHLPEIGIDAIETGATLPVCLALEREDLDGFLTDRDATGNKGSFGKVLVIAGSEEICGAAVLSSKAALLSGAGMVRLYTHEKNRTVIGTAFPEALITTYGNSWSRDEIKEAMDWADSILIGPGIGRSDQAREMLDFVLSDPALPAVIDADALNLLSEEPNSLLKHHGKWILTPHMGEMARLTGKGISWLKEHALEAAETFARDYQVDLILKDATTVTALPCGRTYLNSSGNSGMATAGSGDVLAGLCAGYLAQKKNPEEVAAYAVFIHGMAGDLAAAKKGKGAMIAGDILEALPQITRDGGAIVAV